MTPAEVDEALERFGAQLDVIAERLVALDGHPGHRILDGAQLVGDSQRRWAEAKDTIAQLWAQFEAFRETLTAAREIRARRPRPSSEDLAELSRLLGGPSVELPLDSGALTAARTERVGMAELVSRMTGAYQPVFDLVSQAADTWSQLAGRLDPLTEQLAEARSSAHTLGVHDWPELSTVDTQLAALRTDALSDPLVRRDDLDARLRATAGELDRLTQRLAELQRLRERYPQERERLGGRIDQVAEAEAAAARLRDTVAAKIAGPVAAPPVPVGARLHELAERLDELYQRQRWDQLGRRFAELDAQTASALQVAQAAARGLQELLDRRAELRGRLDAYKAMAGRLGFGEDSRLAELHRQARDLLWTAPCDLAAATRAVAAYQQAILGLKAGRGEVVT